MMRSSREIADTLPALCSIPFDQLDDCRATGSEHQAGKGGILSLCKEELDHDSANGLRVLGIFDTRIV